MLRYSLLRILVFLFFLLGFFLVLELADVELGSMGVFWLVVAAALASMVASLFLLKAPRADFSAQIDDAIAKREASRSRKHAVSDEAVEDDAPYGPGSARSAADGSGPEGWAIKGNADSGLFHTEESPGYENTRAEVWFADEASAIAAGALAVSSADLTRRAVAVRGAKAAPLGLYPLWCTFATALSTHIWVLNRR